MFPQITAEQAAQRSWDVVVCGSSFAAMFFLRALPKNLSVLIVEKGPVQEHTAQISDQISGAEQFSQSNTSGAEKTWIAHSVFGGNSNCWWACTPRFHPSDFQMQSLYGVMEDWPISYDDLAPFYQEVEQVMQISGGGSDHILPRQVPFPYPAHTPSRSDKYLQSHSPNWFAQPAARANGGDRATCCANGVCNLCPVDAKFTILNSHSAFARPEAFLLPETEVRQVKIEAGQVSGVVLRDSGGHVFEVNCDLVALGTNAIFNAAIMIRSGLDHPMIGRGLNEQVSRIVVLDGDQLGHFGGTSITGHGYDLYDGAHRQDHSGVLLEVYNSPVAVRTEFGKWDQRAHLKLIAEDLPQVENRVILSTDAEQAPHFEWSGHSNYAQLGLDWAVRTLPSILPQDLEIVEVSKNAPTEAHILGTHRMGNDPTLHVLDENMNVRGVTGLLALGSGAFTTGSMANPSLTISALSTRAARRLV